MKLKFFVLVVLPLTLRAQCDVQDFGFEDNYLKIKFKRAVFAIVSKGKNGSAFMVDLEKGFLLTSGHVIQDSLSVFISNPFLNKGQPIQVSLISEYKEKDIALLKIKSADLLKKLRPYLAELDISLKGVENGVDYVSLSFPDKILFDINIMRTRLKRKIQQDYVEMYINARSGMSGSPLLDKKGYVVAIADTKEIDQVSGEFRELSESFSVLRKIGVSSEANSVLKSLKEGPLNEERLALLIEAEPGSRPLRNLDIINSLPFASKKIRQSYDSAITPHVPCISSTLSVRGFAGLIPMISNNFASAERIVPVLLSAAVTSTSEKKSALLYGIANEISVYDIAINTGMERDEVRKILAKLPKSTQLDTIEQKKKDRWALGLNMLSMVSLCKNMSSRNLDEALKFSKASLTLTKDLAINNKSESVIFMVNHSKKQKEISTKLVLAETHSNPLLQLKGEN